MEWVSFWSSVVVASLGIGGVILGQVLSNRRERDRANIDIGHKRDDSIRQELLELYVRCLDELQDCIVNEADVARLTHHLDAADKAGPGIMPKAEELATSLRAGMTIVQSITKLMYKVDLIGSHEVRMCFRESVRMATSRSSMDEQKWSENLGRLDTKLRVLMRRDLELHRPSLLNVNPT